MSGPQPTPPPAGTAVVGRSSPRDRLLPMRIAATAVGPPTGQAAPARRRPAGQGVERVRLVRDEIDARVRALLTELVPAAGRA